jgi:hypothetical protein
MASGWFRGAGNGAPFSFVLRRINPYFIPAERISG